MVYASGTIYGSTSSQFVPDAKIVWSQDYVDTANNRSLVTATLYLYSTSTSATESSDSSFTIYVNGTGKTVNGRFTIKKADGWVCPLGCSVTVEVEHGSDGTKTVEIYATGRMRYTTLTSISCSGNATLTPIATASTISYLTNTCEIDGANSVSVTINRKQSAFTHTVEYRLDASHDVTVTNVGTSHTFTPPVEWRQATAFNTSTSATMTVSVTTFNGGTQVGQTVSRTCMLTVVSGGKPVLTNSNVTISPYYPSGTPDAITRSGLYVQGFTGMTVTLINTNNYGADTAITSESVTVAGQLYGITASSGTHSKNTDVINSGGTVSAVVSATDSRNNTGTITISKPFEAYSYPSVSNVTVFRCDSAGQASATGSYYSVTATAIYSSISGRNSISLFRVRHSQNAGWTNITSGTRKKINAGLSDTSSYTVEINVVDAVGRSTTYVTTIPSRGVTFNLKNGGLGAAFGMYAQTDYVFELGAGWKLKAPTAEVDDIKVGEWTALTLLNGAVATENDPPSYKIIDGYVYIRGCLQVSAGNTTVVFTIPSGARPSETIHRALAGSDYCSVIQITSDSGDVYLRNRAYSGGDYYGTLETCFNISYPVAQGS